MKSKRKINLKKGPREKKFKLMRTKLKKKKIYHKLELNDEIEKQIT